MFGVRDITVTPEAPAALIVPLADVKAFLGITDAAQDATVTAQIQAATQSIEDYCRTLFAQRSITENIHGEDANYTLVLTHSPAANLSAIAFDDAAGTPSDFSLLGNLGMLRRKDGAAIAASKITVSYQAGYTSTPPLVAQAVKEFVAAIRAAPSRPAGVASESVPDVGSVSYTADGGYGAQVPPAVASLLAPYAKRFAP